MSIDHNYQAPAYGDGFKFAGPIPPRAMSKAPRDAAIIQDWLTADEGRTEQCLECELDIDFDREDKPVKVLQVYCVIWRRSPCREYIDGKSVFSADAKQQWLKVAQEYADDLADYELEYLRGKVRKAVVLTGGKEQ